MKPIIPILLIIVLAACNQNQEAEVETDFSKIVLIDTFENELVIDTTSYIRRVKYYPLYIGEYQDTITLKYVTEGINLPEKYIDIEYKYPDSLDIRIFIDTSKTIGSGVGVLPKPPFPKDYTPKLRGKYKSYPVFIENLSKDTFALGSGNLVSSPILEALDSNGIWKSIERTGMYMCGTGLKSFYLLPNEVLVTHAKTYNGDYKTKFRLVLDCYRKKIVSNEFEGAIDSKLMKEGY